MRDLTFRTPDLDDSRAIAEFQTVCWREAYVGVVPQVYLDSTGPDERQRRWAARILGSERDILVAEDGDRIVGVVSWGDGSWLDVSGLELKSLYVSADQRGSGLATTLLQRSIGDAPAFLWVYEANPRAHAFYRRHGFEPNGVSEPDADSGATVIMLQR
ncbi:GNAT family N-acetyltransferase [Aeromicrobium ginsengisoli]|uniref:GNAT family N-acetyltransferase n=1 Tax=Aeromicrobium ginsengisoli TaxID=363867 RepID=A0A5M4FFT8_9ACTN|nr:GNAT family N-acetyltransferase [Aeromicrobium ginsengisoli]KAA1398155.1 GNAT family N-acetyltransferase [Aeromicrobium ginsengisoli]